MSFQLRNRVSGVGEETLFISVTTADGKRRVYHDNLGTLTAVADGTELVVGDFRHVYRTRDNAIARGARLLAGRGFLFESWIDSRGQEVK